MISKNQIAVLILVVVLGLPAFATDAPAGLEDVPKEMLRQSVLSDHNGKFELGIPNLNVHWSSTSWSRTRSFATSEPMH
jgi:hypothetical protein